MTPAQTAPPKLRPLRLSDLLDAIFQLYRNNFLTFIGIVGLLLLPVGIAQAVLIAIFQNRAMTDLPEQFARLSVQPDINPLTFFGTFLGTIGGSLALMMIVGLIQAFLVQPTMYGAVVWATSQRLYERPMSIMKAYGYGIGRMLSLVVATLIGSLVMILFYLAMISVIVIIVVLFFTTFQSRPASDSGLFILAIPVTIGLAMILSLLILAVITWLITRLIFVPQAIALEGKGPLIAFTRSWTLTRGSFWRILGSMFVLVFIAFALSSAVSMMLQYLIMGAVLLGTQSSNPETIMAATQGAITFLQYLMNILLFPIYGIGTTLLYYDLLMRKEGVDLHHRIQMVQPQPQTTIGTDAG